MSSAKERQLFGLYFRHNFCNGCIQLLLTDPDLVKDENQPSALAHYKKQLAEIDEKITALEKERRQHFGLPEPEPVTVQLNTVFMTVKTPH